MKNNILIMLVFVSIFQLALSADKGDEKKPAVKFKELNYDFGKVSPGILLEHNFSFTNVGGTKLLIQSVQPSCGCTGVSIGDKKEFENGETGEIKITFKTEGRLGLINKTVTVSTNDPVSPQVTLTFTCEIIENK